MGRYEYATPQGGESCGYAVVPRYLLLDPHISSEAKVLYAHLSVITDSATSRLLAERMRCSQRSIRRWMKELRDAGWVQ